MWLDGNGGGLLKHCVTHQLDYAETDESSELCMKSSIFDMSMLCISCNYRPNISRVSLLCRRTTACALKS